jgi:hypothetical protein
MPISNISSSFNSDLFQEWQSVTKQRRQDFSQLASALQSGDLSSAQSAYTDLIKLQESSQTSSTTGSGKSSGDSPLKSDFDALGQALSSGDITQAQQAFNLLKSDLQSALRGSHHADRHHHLPAGVDSSTTMSNSSSEDSSTGSVNLLA